MLEEWISLPEFGLVLNLDIQKENMTEQCRERDISLANLTMDLLPNPTKFLSME